MKTFVLGNEFSEVTAILGQAHAVWPSLQSLTKVPQAVFAHGPHWRHHLGFP